MAARKLQTEIDRTLKKVAEGVELFESIYEKMQNSTNQTQKEKLEMDLKTQIKRLQRLRDQIKTWAASNDIKDKSALLENRRLIETQMEKFKACEKEMKTKAFSKEGLIQSAKLDPKAQEKLDTASWVREQVEALQQQVEHTEAEIEAAQMAGGKKKGKSGGQTAERVEEMEKLNERRRWHTSRLEIILRLLDNGSLPVEKITALKDDVQYFVESNAEEDFEEDEGIYDDLNLDEEEEKFGIAADESSSDESEEASEDLPPRTPNKKQQHEDDSSSKRDGSPVLKKGNNVTLQLRKPSSAADSAPKPPPNPNFAQQPMSSILKAGLPPAPRQPAQLPPIRYAAAAAAAVNPPSSTSATPSVSSPSQAPASTNATTPPSSSALSPPQPTASQDHAATSSPSLTHPSVTSPMLSSASVSALQQDGSSYYSHHDSPALSEAVSGSLAPTSSSPQRSASRSVSISSPIVDSASPAQPQAASNDSQKPPAAAEQPPAPSPPAPAPAPSQQQQQQALPVPIGAPTAPSPLPQQVQQYPQYPPGVKVPEQQQMPMQAVGAQRPPSTQQRGSVPPQMQQARTAFPGSLSDLVVSFENVKQKAVHRMGNLDQVNKLLEGSYSSMPQPQDTEKPKYYVPRNYFPTPSYYPQQPSPILSTAGLFAQLDVETLFYVFYYHPGTYLQYLAAKELKRQSWRFHVKYLTWFQRHSEPQAITEEYEQGVYVYFDWEGSWCQRKKSDFRFEYRYLSED
ncbi:hypothetical protein GLOTRDRAFT_71257 [Gloeophyllum trabeum ATCC 11539]|uniref:General negative regulator of transcription subunit n=1 Tax=Gloeophyllum trabeum (strain ATCC 11539 / FP-39264 / Madison 617) TaxID=670483 RepID=S7QJ15_GLOTA|nr:uncharacterized protein GLOTRDRAFT_71257 [Gloeophyllum trabeum ATCC 11539]EPQ59641.1 hypothetical protein GLOTRDRAFT_71257 [Gloeophyllum trabeum ATCC 11539]